MEEHKKERKVFYSRADPKLKSLDNFRAHSCDLWKNIDKNSLQLHFSTIWLALRYTRMSIYRSIPGVYRYTSNVFDVLVFSLSLSHRVDKKNPFILCSLFWSKYRIANALSRFVIMDINFIFFYADFPFTSNLMWVCALWVVVVMDRGRLGHFHVTSDAEVKIELSIHKRIA